MRTITCVQFWMALQTCPSYAVFGQCSTSVVLFMYLRFCLTKYFLPFTCYFTFWLFLSLKLHECAFFLHPLQNAGAAVLAWCPAGSALAVLQHAAPCWTTTLRESVFYLLRCKPLWDRYVVKSSQHSCISWNTPECATQAHETACIWAQP